MATVSCLRGCLINSPECEEETNFLYESLYVDIAHCKIRTTKMLEFSSVYFLRA